MGRFQLELIYLYFPPSFHLTLLNSVMKSSKFYTCICSPIRSLRLDKKRIPNKILNGRFYNTRMRGTPGNRWEDAVNSHNDWESGFGKEKEKTAEWRRRLQEAKALRHWGPLNKVSISSRIQIHLFPPKEEWQRVVHRLKSHLVRN